MSQKTPGIIKTIKKKVHPKNEIKRIIDKPSRPIMMQPPFRLLTIARSQTGKTTLLIKLLHYYWIKMFTKIYIFCPTYLEQAKWSSLDKYVKSGKIKVYPVVDEKILKKIWNKYKELKSKGSKHNVLILFDDCTGQKEFKVNQETGIINLMVSKANHAGISIAAAVQKITQASTIMRSQAEGVLTFSCLQEKEIKPLYDEFGVGKLKNFREMVINSTLQPYHYLYINRQGPGIPDYYHNFKFICVEPTG